MAYRESRETAIELYKSGLGCSEIARRLGVNLRNVQRWCQDVKVNNTSVEISKPTQPTQATLATVRPPISSNNWANNVSALLAEHSAMHGEIRVAMFEALKAELNGDEPNPKRIHGLSLAVTRHADRELSSLAQGRAELLNFSQAIELIEAKGFVVVEKSLLEVSENV